MSANGTARRVRIAVLDDEPAVRAALRRLLCATGYRVDSFDSGVAFLASIRVQRPACVILDYAMPGLSGLDVLHRLRSDELEIPVIVLTGSDDEDLERRSIEAGARALLRKPVLAGDLFAVLEATMRHAN